MGRPKALDFHYTFEVQSIDEILNHIQKKEDRPLEKFKFPELHEGLTMHICSKETLKKYIIDPMGKNFPIFLTNTITLTEKMANNFCDMTVVIFRKRGTSYSDHLKKEIINYQVQDANKIFRNDYQNSINNYIIPEILFEEYWEKKEEYDQARSKHYSYRSRSLNKEAEFFKELEQLINDKNSIIYKKYKYAICGENYFFDGFPPYINIYYAIPVNSLNNVFIFSNRNQNRLLNLLGFQKDEYVNIDVQLINKYFRKKVKNSCFPHIFENIKFCVSGVFISKDKIPYITLYIGIPGELEIKHRIDRVIVLPFYMVKKCDQEMFYDDSKEKVKKIMENYDIESYQFFEIFERGSSHRTIYYFNNYYNLRAIRYTDKKNRTYIKNKLSDKVTKKLINKLLENKQHAFEISKECSNGD